MTGLWFDDDEGDASYGENKAGYVLRATGDGDALIYAIAEGDVNEVYIPREAIPSVIDALRRISETPQLDSEDED